MTNDGEEWLIYQMGVLPFQGTSTAWRNEPTGTSGRFRKEKFQVLYLGRNSPMHQHRLEDNWKESSSAEKGQGIQEIEHESALYP